MTEQEAYITLQEKYGLRIGDTVRVLRRAKSNEMGWVNSWTDEMDTTVGNEYEILDILGNIGVLLKGIDCCFPFFVLEKVKEVERTQIDIINEYLSNNSPIVSVMKDLGLKDIDPKTSQIYDPSFKYDKFYRVSLEEIVNAVINRVKIALDSFKE